MSVTKTKMDWDILEDEFAQLKLKLKRSEADRARLEVLKKSHETHLLGTMRDIEKARSEVIERERDLALILEATGDAYFTVDLSGVVQSERLSALLNELKVPSLIGKSIFSELQHHFQSSAFNSMSIVDIHLIEMCDKVMLWIPRSIPNGILWIVRDETEKAKLHRELETSLRERAHELPRARRH